MRRKLCVNWRKAPSRYGSTQYLRLHIAGWERVCFAEKMCQGVTSVGLRGEILGLSRWMFYDERGIHNRGFTVVEVGKMIRLRRKQLGLTQAELATKVEVSQQTIAALENGYVRKTTCLPSLFHILGLDITVVMKEAGQAPTVEAYSLLSQEDMATITDSLRDTMHTLYNYHALADEPFTITLDNIEYVVNTLCDDITKHLPVQKR